MPAQKFRRSANDFVNKRPIDPEHFGGFLLFKEMFDLINQPRIGFGVFVIGRLGF
jgi:hypothetical protein